MAPATLYVAVEVLEILCRYGPAGLATLVLRREFCGSSRAPEEGGRRRRGLA